MIGSLNAEAASAKRRRARKLRKLGRWLLGTVLTLIVVAILGVLIVLPFKSYFDEVEAKEQAERDLLYKIYHYRR